MGKFLPQTQIKLIRLTTTLAVLLRKAIMKRSKLRNGFLKDGNDASQSAYRKQRNLCVTLLRKVKKQYFWNLEPKLITDNKKFWNSVKPLFSDKITVKEIINLTENGEILTSNTDKADTFNDYFSSVVKKGYNEKIKIT